MRESVIGKSIYLLPGMQATLTVTGYFVDNSTTKHVQSNIMGERTKEVSLINGFWVEDEDVGEIEPAADGVVGVTYTHKKAGNNSIWFHARTGEVGLVNVISVPIHDHSSIVQGGPAYGTYFTDDDAQDAGSESTEE